MAVSNLSVLGTSSPRELQSPLCTTPHIAGLMTGAHLWGKTPEWSQKTLAWSSSTPESSAESGCVLEELWPIFCLSEMVLVKAGEYGKGNVCMRALSESTKYWTDTPSCSKMGTSGMATTRWYKSGSEWAGLGGAIPGSASSSGQSRQKSGQGMNIGS